MNKKSLSLIEIIVSVVILAIIMTGMAGVFVSGKRFILHSRSRMTVGELGRYFLRDFQAQVNQSRWGQNCLSNSSLCSDSSMEKDGISYNASYATSVVAGTNLSRVTVNITWNETSPQ